MARIYIDKKTEVAARDVLRIYGIEAKPERDKRGRYFEWTVPEYWGAYRRAKFDRAIMLLSNS